VEVAGTRIIIALNKVILKISKGDYFLVPYSSQLMKMSGKETKGVQIFQDVSVKKFTADKEAIIIIIHCSIFTLKLPKPIRNRRKWKSPDLIRL
jgi:hypothetical protein